MDWSLEVTTLFIEDYRNSPVLWNTALSDYKDNRIKTVKLKELATKYNCTVRDVKKKIKNLRSAFHRERRKLQSNSRKGKWFAYDLLSFLLDVDIPQSALSNAGSNDEDFEEEEQKFSPDTQYAEAVPAETGKLNKIPNKRNRNSCEEEHEKLTSSKKTRKDISTSGREEEAYIIMKNARQRDDCSTYGAHVANELRNLSYRARTMVKHIINNTLFEAAMGKYDADDDPGTPVHKYYETNSCGTVLSSEESSTNVQ